MAKFQSQRVLPYSAHSIAALVLNIEEYPSFLPWCSKGEIISQEPQQLIADLVINFKGTLGKYRSKIDYQIVDTKHIVKIQAIDGPFKYLRSSWVIHTLDAKQAKVDFEIEFAMKSLLLDKLFSSFLNQIAQEMVGAFEARMAELNSK